MFFFYIYFRNLVSPRSNSVQLSQFDFIKRWLTPLPKVRILFSKAYIVESTKASSQQKKKKKKCQFSRKHEVWDPPVGPPINGKLGGLKIWVERSHVHKNQPYMIIVTLSSVAHKSNIFRWIQTQRACELQGVSSTQMDQQVGLTTGYARCAWCT